MWRDFFDAEYCIYEDTLIFKVVYLNGVTAFSLPLGTCVNESLKEIESYCNKQNIPLVFCTATEEDIAFYKNTYPSIRLTPNEDWNDYLYRAEDLITLSGRKYSGQRNHMNYFIKNYPNFIFEEIDNQNIMDVKQFYLAATTGIEKNTNIFHEEKAKTLEVLDHYGEYCLLGGLLRVDRSIVAFAIGEKIKDTLFVHIERADNNYRGASQMIVNLFPKYFANEDVSFINREEDVGDEGLRTAKKAYHPIQIIKKYTVEVGL